MRTVIYCGRVIACDGQAEKRKQYITVEDGCIRTVSQACPESYDSFLDWQEYTVMPGLINCHTHVGILPAADSNLVLRYPLSQRVVFILKHLKQLLASGVTTIRDMGCYEGVDLELRDFVRSGQVLGPDMYVSGPMLTMTGGHAHTVGVEVDGVDECRKETRRRLKSGVDVVKLMATGGVLTKGVEPGASQLTLEEMTVICQEAHKAGRRVAAHAQGNEGIRNALKAGVDSIEHGFYLDEQLVEEMVARGTWYVPTFCAPWFMAEKGEELGLAQEFLDKVLASRDAHAASFSMALKGGVKIACGTDASTPFNGHDLTAKELTLLCEHGMTPAQAIEAATKNAAQCIGLSDRGQILPGMRADLIAVEGDPLKDIHCLEDGVRYVAKQGRIYSTAGLKEYL